MTDIDAILIWVGSIIAALAVIAAACYMILAVAAYGTIVALAMLVSYFINATGFFVPFML